jgi:hypothetical protein
MEDAGILKERLGSSLSNEFKCSDDDKLSQTKAE